MLQHGLNNSSAVPVLAALIRQDNEFLICKRPRHKRYGGLWEFPGGKVEPGESWLDAARRELAEELGVEVTSVGEPIFAFQDPGSDFEIFFVNVRINGIPKALEHEEIRWLPLSALTAIDLAPSDHQFVLWLQHEERK